MHVKMWVLNRSLGSEIHAMEIKYLRIKQVSRMYNLKNMTTMDELGIKSILEQIERTKLD